MATPLTYLLKFKARRVIFNLSCPPSLFRTSRGTISPIVSWTTSYGNLSCPASTGVWVVNMQRSLTVSRFIPFFRSNSRVRRLEWPSFMWYFLIWKPDASSIFTPPIPKTISCFNLYRSSPPYKKAVMSLSSAVLSSTLLSRKRIETIPPAKLW